MAKSITQEAIAELNLSIESYKETLQEIDALRAALATHKGKLVDARFFAKHFTETRTNEYGTFSQHVRYGLKVSQYSYRNGEYDLRLRHDTVETPDRTTESLKDALDTMYTLRVEWIAKCEEKVTTLSKLNESAVIADLVAVYERHGKPSIWREILDSYAVQYPNK